MDRRIRILPERNAGDGQMGESAVWELLKKNFSPVEMPGGSE
jgi:hypothetical protein